MFRKKTILMCTMIAFSAAAAWATGKMIDREKLALFVKKRIGIPYLWGGCTERGYDCSGFVMRAFQDQGILLPRTSYLQSLSGDRVGREELTHGDLVFFDTRNLGKVSHVGIYLQDDTFVHASSSKGITISDLGKRYYRSRFLSARRVAPGRNHLKESREKLAEAPEQKKEFVLKEAFIVGLEGFLSQEEALGYQMILLEKGYDAFITYERDPDGRDVYRVGIGFFPTEQSAAEFIMKDEYIQGMVYFILKQQITEGDGV